MSRSIEHFVEEFPEEILGVTYLRKKLHINWLGGVLAITAYNSEEGIYQHRLHINGQQVGVEGTAEHVVSELQKIQDHLVKLWVEVDSDNTYYHIVSSPANAPDSLLYLGKFTKYQMKHKVKLLQATDKCWRYYVFVSKPNDYDNCVKPVTRDMLPEAKELTKMGYVDQHIPNENELQLWIKGVQL